MSYIGSSKNLGIRLKNHLNQLKRGTHSNPHLQNAFNKHGECKFSFDVLACADDNIIALEQAEIDKRDFKNLYNIYEVAGCTKRMIEKRTGGRLSKEHREKISKANIGRVVTKKTRDKLRKKHTGKKLSQEHIDKMAQTKRGQKLTQDHKRNISKGVLFSNKKNPNNKTGVKGVHVLPDNRYRVRVQNKSYGCYNTLEEAKQKSVQVYDDLRGGVSSLK